MKVAKRKTAMVAALGLGLCLVGACSGERPANKDCGAILQSSCASCHAADWVCRKLGARSSERWLETLDRMVQHGAVLTFEEKTTLLDCLVQHPEQVMAACAGARP